jgi:hypothetical protein
MIILIFLQDYTACCYKFFLKLSGTLSAGMSGHLFDKSGTLCSGIGGTLCSGIAGTLYSEITGTL